MSLGADRGQVQRMILREGGVLLAFGLMLGVAGAFFAAGVIRGLLFGVAPHDPATFIGVAVMMAAIGTVACWIPAIRAAYRSGRLTSGGGGLRNLPIIDYRAYADDDPVGNIHLRYHSFSMRERLTKANGDAGNQVMLVEDMRYGLYSSTSPLLQFALRKNERTRVRAIPVVQKDRSRHKLRDSHEAHQENDGGKHHLKDAEAPLAAVAFCECQWHSCFFSLVFQLANPLPGASGGSGPDLRASGGK